MLFLLNTLAHFNKNILFTNFSHINKKKTEKTRRIKIVSVLKAFDYRNKDSKLEKQHSNSRKMSIRHYNLFEFLIIDIK